MFPETSKDMSLRHQSPLGFGIWISCVGDSHLREAALARFACIPSPPPSPAVSAIPSISSGLKLCDKISQGSTHGSRQILDTKVDSAVKMPTLALKAPVAADKKRTDKGSMTCPKTPFAIGTPPKTLTTGALRKDVKGSQPAKKKKTVVRPKLIDRLGSVIEFEKNTNPVYILGTFNLKLKSCVDPSVTFRYTFNPLSMEEKTSVDYRDSRDFYPKLELMSTLNLDLDRKGNFTPENFLNGMVKLSAKFDGTIHINGYSIYWDKTNCQRLKLQSVDIDTNPAIFELVSTGAASVNVKGSTTDLQISVRSEFQPKWQLEGSLKTIRFDGPRARDILVCSTEEEGGLFVCLPLELKTAAVGKRVL